MVKLIEYASNMYSQYGEDGIIEEILNRIEVGPGFCVEFGASEGLACSNTAKLWRHEDWEALLIEADPVLITRLAANIEGRPGAVRWVNETVTPGNINALIGQPEIDLISIDIDGDDFWVFCAMQCRAKVVVIEYNRTIPPHIDLVPELGNNVGIGSFTLKNAAEQRGYTFLGLTEGSAIFVDTRYAGKFSDIEKRLEVLQPPEQFIYLASDLTGHVLPLGKNPPWGLEWPQSEATFTPHQDNLLVILAGDPIERLIRGVESLAFYPQQLEELRSNAMQIALDMRGGYNEELRDRIEQELGLR